MAQEVEILKFKYNKHLVFVAYHERPFPHCRVTVYTEQGEIVAEYDWNNRANRPSELQVLGFLRTKGVSFQTSLSQRRLAQESQDSNPFAPKEPANAKEAAKAPEAQAEPGAEGEVTDPEAETDEEGNPIPEGEPEEVVIEPPAPIAKTQAEMALPPEAFTNPSQSAALDPNVAAPGSSDDKTGDEQIVNAPILEEMGGNSLTDSLKASFADFLDGKSAKTMAEKSAEIKSAGRTAEGQ